MKRFTVRSFFMTFLVVIAVSCGHVKEPDFKGIENVRVTKFGFSESTLSLDLAYFNRNNFRVKLKEADGDVWFDDKLLGHFTIDTLIHIPANADFKLPVLLKANMGEVLKNSLATFLNKDKEVTVKVEGNARLGKGFVYSRYPLHYEGKMKLGELIK